MSVTEKDTLFLTRPNQVERWFSNTNASIEGLELPEMDVAELTHDLDLAPHLRSLLNVNLESTGACCVIHSDNEELGLLAAAYIAVLHGGVYESDPLDLHDYVRCHAPEDLDEINPDNEMLLFQDGFLPIYRPSSEAAFFDIQPVSDIFISASRARPVRLPSWHTMSSSHPIVLIPDSVSEENLLAEVKRQTAMRSLTLVVLPNISVNAQTVQFGARPTSPFFLSAELQFSFAAEVVTVHQPAPACRYNQLLLHQMLAESDLTLESRCSSQTLLKALNTFRAKHDGVTNNNIYKYVRLLHHLYPPKAGATLTRKQALKPISQLPQTRQKAQRPCVQLYGCENVKRQLRSVVDTMTADKERRTNRLPAAQHGQVLLFAGAPGTGKTTAARLLHQWLEDRDLLDDGYDATTDYYQVSGAQLKAPFVGQTAPMIHDLFTHHSFLFIDEAYALAEAGLSGSNNDHFAQEAMGQLCIELENLPADHVVVFAGYGGDHDNRMRAFLNANPGLASRITRTIQFDPYSPDKELPEIFSVLAQDRGFTLPGHWQSVVVPYFRRRAREEDFGSGRESRRLLESCVLVQSHRLVKDHDFRPTALAQLTLEDLRMAVADLESGFRALQDNQSLPCGLGRGLTRSAEQEETA